MAPPVLQETGVAVTRRELDRLMCDSAITRVIFGPRGEVLDVGRTYRTFTGARRRALDAHDGGCAYPGCDLPRASAKATTPHPAAGPAARPPTPTKASCSATTTTPGSTTTTSPSPATDTRRLAVHRPLRSSPSAPPAPAPSATTSGPPTPGHTPPRPPPAPKPTTHPDPARPQPREKALLRAAWDELMAAVGEICNQRHA